MSDYDANRILKPQFFSISHLKQGRGNRARAVIGFDSESDKGRPFMFQFSEHGDESDVEIIDIPADAHDQKPLDLFTRWVCAHCTDKQTEYLIFGWNLQYEWTQLFASLPRDFATMGDWSVVHTLRHADGTPEARFNIHVFNDKRYAATWVRLGLTCIAKCTPDNHKCGSKRRVRVLDGMAYYVTGLDKAGEMLGLGRKLAKPMRFGRDQSQYPYFRDYARQDAYLTRRIGETIVDMHREHDVEQTISAPHFASTVFKRHYLKEGIPLPDIGLEQAGLSSYHGGKNGYYHAGPKHFHDVFSYDITSAYPEAMRALPDLETATFEADTRYRRGLHGLYRINGHYTPCRYHCLLDHAGRPLRAGGVHDVWFTSYEVDAAISCGSLTIDNLFMYIMRGQPGGGMADYVDHFFEMKRLATGAKRAAAKLFLNSLYGKFFQKTPLGIVGYLDPENADGIFIVTDPTQEHDWQAGGLYHPPIASLITGYVRAKIHRLEHKYEAIMTSTDGFFAMKPPDPADIGTALGMLTVERGDLMIWRERLYDFTPRSGKEPKYALHGFRGDRDALRKIPLVPGSYSYKAQQMVTLRLSTHKLGIARHTYAPGEFAMLDYTLDLTTATGPPPH